jgi:hypothetical protein
LVGVVQLLARAHQGNLIGCGDAKLSEQFVALLLSHLAQLFSFCNARITEFGDKVLEILVGCYGQTVLNPFRE